MATSPGDWAGRETVASERAGAILPGLLPGLLILLIMLMLSGGLWLYSEMSRFGIEHGAAKSAGPLAQWQMTATVFAAITGLMLLGFVLSGYHRTRQTVIRQWFAEREAWEENVKQLQARLAQVRRSEAELRDHRYELEARLSELSREHAELRGELGSVRLAAEVFSHQRRELVRSKGVLELHVQARTEQLQKLERAYELILNSAGEGICGLDISGRINFVNPAAARMMGMEITDMTSRSAREIFPDFMSGAGAAANGVDPMEVTARRRDGSGFGAEFLRTPIREEERIVGEVLLFKDITERKNAAESLARKAAELTRSNAELEQFAFVASHDLQEPLRKIQAFGDRLKAKCVSVNLDEGRDYLDRMQNAAARMQTLIYDLLTFSRVISRTEPFVPVNLQTVVREVISDLEVRIEKTGGRVEVGNLPTLEADAPQMRQLLQNLIGNALKFHAPGVAPVVRVEGRLLGAEPADASANAEAQRCELTVTDNGIGFDEKYLDRIFAVFQRLHGRQEYEGTGIGLAVCRRIAERHGGTITARSKPGEGATFIVTLPTRPPSQAKGSA